MRQDYWEQAPNADCIVRKTEPAQDRVSEAGLRVLILSSDGAILKGRRRLKNNDATRSFLRGYESARKKCRTPGAARLVGQAFETSPSVPGLRPYSAELAKIACKSSSGYNKTLDNKAPLPTANKCFIFGYHSPSGFPGDYEGESNIRKWLNTVAVSARPTRQVRARASNP